MRCGSCWRAGSGWSRSLVSAAAERFAREIAPAALSTAIGWRTTIPRSVGLGGSSAIVIATLRALCECYGVSLGRGELAAFALAVETEDLGIAAGLQDRVAQAYGGVTFMDFDPGTPSSSCHPPTPLYGGVTFMDSDPGGEPASGHGRYEPLGPDLLPPLVIAWRRDAGEDSGTVHGDLRERFEAGDRTVLRSMSELAGLARASREALRAGDREGLARCVDQSFDARARMMTLNPTHVEMIERVRAHRASANYTGSGGAIIAVCRDIEHQAAVVGGLRASGCLAIAPAVAGTGATGAPANPGA